MNLDNIGKITLKQWQSAGGVSASDRDLQVFYHGTQNQEPIEQFTPGGNHSSNTHGDQYGVAVYLTSDAQQAAIYAGPHGAIYPVYVRGKALELRGTESLDPHDAEILSRYANTHAEISDRARFGSSRKSQTFLETQQARDFFEDQRAIWSSRGANLERGRPVVERGSNGGFEIQYTDYEAPITIRSALDAQELLHAIGWNRVADMGFVGVHLHRDDGSAWMIVHDHYGNITSALNTRFQSHNTRLSTPWEFATPLVQKVLNTQSTADFQNLSAEDLCSAIRNPQTPVGSLDPASPTDLPLGSLRISSFGAIESRYVDVLALVDVASLKLAEPEDQIRKNPSYGAYTAMSLQGFEAPAIQVNESEAGELISTNRRRTMVAKDLGLSRIKAWVSPINPATGDPLKYGELLGFLKTHVSEKSSLQKSSQTQSVTPAMPLRDRWMEGNKAVDANGDPVIVFHGSTSDIEHFDLSLSGSDGVSYSRPAIFATSNPDLASEYAIEKFDREIGEAMKRLSRYKSEHPLDFGPKYEELLSSVSSHLKRASKSDQACRGNGANVIPLYVKMTNPLTVSGDGQNYYEVIHAAIEKAHKSGHDGVIVRNIIDSANGKCTTPSDLYIGFDSEQFKSALANDLSFKNSCPFLNLQSQHRYAEEVGMQAMAGAVQITLAAAHRIMKGNTEKPGGTDPCIIYANGPNDKRVLLLTFIAVNAIARNEEGQRYDGTVNLDLARTYASRESFAPPINLTQSRRSKELRVLDGGHRISAARMRGDESIMAFAEIDKTPLIELKLNELPLCEIHPNDDQMLVISYKSSSINVKFDALQEMIQSREFVFDERMNTINSNKKTARP